MWPFLIYLCSHLSSTTIYITTKHLDRHAWTRTHSQNILIVWEATRKNERGDEEKTWKTVLSTCRSGLCTWRGLLLGKIHLQFYISCFELALYCIFHIRRKKSPPHGVVVKLVNSLLTCWTHKKYIVQHALFFHYNNAVLSNDQYNGHYRP